MSIQKLFNTGKQIFKQSSSKIQNLNCIVYGMIVVLIYSIVSVQTINSKIIKLLSLRSHLEFVKEL